MNDTTKQALIEEAKVYTADEFSRYISEAGWQDWMNEYTSAGDGELATEGEITRIEAIQAELFAESQLQK